MQLLFNEAEKLISIVQQRQYSSQCLLRKKIIYM